MLAFLSLWPLPYDSMIHNNYKWTSFKFVGNDGFGKFMDETRPRLKIPSNTTLARDCIQVFNVGKELSKCILSTNNQTTSLVPILWLQFSTWVRCMSVVIMLMRPLGNQKGNYCILVWLLNADHKDERPLGWPLRIWRKIGELPRVVVWKLIMQVLVMLPFHICCEFDENYTNKTLDVWSK